MKETMMMRGNKLVVISPQEFAAIFARKIVKWAKVVKASGTKTQLSTGDDGRLTTDGQPRMMQSVI